MTRRCTTNPRPRTGAPRKRANAKRELIPRGPHFFSEIVRVARERRGYNKTEFAELCGVTQPAISHWECGRAPLTEATIEKVAKGLRQSVEDLLRTELKYLAAERRAIDTRRPWKARKRVSKMGRAA